ncbi:alpha/beta hydrolase family esterase [Fibrella forsythiae]|uniref:Poly(3-hydroxybutyrate) depolymerase n=1 Tax=Fibrella forsythiae TaxID=2817061 RepID=A0ABS3JHR8_9BACT|nr:PHB depolymerase family esterase [Fibrella forsythiae]MBO0948961.1 poly(3-hydroxybutyrate) depolymerase [Fibrella forsythiae]
MIRLTLALALLLSVSIIANAQVLSDSILVEGNYRTFYFNKPPDTFRKPSLVFVLHGSGGNGRDMMKAAVKMDQQAANENTLVVYPSGYKRYWNECRKSSPAQANVENVNEQAFFDGMIQYFRKRYSVDTKHVFAVGTSGGGHMAYKLALTMPRAFRAITAIIANLPDTTNLDCEPAGKAVPVMIINGTDDTTNPYNGGVVVLGKNMNMGAVRSTDRTLAYWANLAHYQGKPTMENVPDTDPNDGKIVERYMYKEKGKPEIVLLKVNGGKHDYPNDIDVHLEALAFFKRQIQ